MKLLSYGACKTFYNNQRGITQRPRKGEQPVLYATHRLDQIHILIKFQENIPNRYRVMGCTRMKITQNKHTQKRSKGHICTSETKEWKATIIIIVYDMSY